jgi:prepilin-type N-terminal cleavage/methylation domain-containing protein
VSTPGRRGFTVLELLIVITLLGVATTIAAGAFSAAIKSTRAGEIAIESADRLRTSLMIMDAQVQSGMLQAGEPEMLQLATTYSAWGGHRSYVAVEYRVAKRGAKLALFTTEYRMGSRKGVETVLLDGCDSIDFKYFVKGAMEMTGRWVDTWMDKAAKPERINFHFRYKGQEYNFLSFLRLRT